MLASLLRAFGDLRAPPLARIVWLSLALAIASFAALWVLVGMVLAESALFGWRPLNWLVDLLGAIATLVLSWLLFPAVVTIVTGFFLDRIASIVEAMHYPGRGPGRRAPILEIIATTMRLMGITILLNLLVMPVYVLAPGLNFFVFLGLNGYLLGREYFEVIALRRLDPTAVRGVRHRFAGRLFVAGVVIAGLFAVPVVNLAAPVVATAFMVHLFAALPWGESQLPAL